MHPPPTWSDPTGLFASGYTPLPYENNANLATNNFQNSTFMGIKLDTTTKTLKKNSHIIDFNQQGLYNK